MLQNGMSECDFAFIRSIVHLTWRCVTSNQHVLRAAWWDTSYIIFKLIPINKMMQHTMRLDYLCTQWVRNLSEGAIPMYSNFCINRFTEWIRFQIYPRFWFLKIISDAWKLNVSSEGFRLHSVAYILSRECRIKLFSR